MTKEDPESVAFRKDALARKQSEQSERIAALHATRPYDGRRVTLHESRGGWKYVGLSGTCLRISEDEQHMVLRLEHDPNGFWPVGGEVLVELGGEPVYNHTRAVFGEYS